MSQAKGPEFEDFLGETVDCRGCFLYTVEDSMHQVQAYRAHKKTPTP